MTPADVLVVGAGPTGLALALQSHAHGARVRIVERRPTAFRPSRAMIVHPRSLELLRPLGVTGELLERGDASPRVCLHLGRAEVPVELGDVALPGTAFPNPIFLRQMDLEAVLSGALASRGVAVERGTDFVGLEPGEPSRVTLRTPGGGLETSGWPLVVGCDGAESAVRRGAGIGWPGGTYRAEAVLADVDLSGDLSRGVTHVAAGRRGLLFLFSLGEGAPWRLLGTRAAGPDAGTAPPGRSGPAVPDAELQQLVDDAGLRARLTGVAWSARVRLQHRVAGSFRRGGVFLAGDAAHASSPAGGQGMNTGLHDALNLGWKLALAGRSSEPDRLLDSYDEERRGAAHEVLALTHLLFWAEASPGPLPALLRATVAPRLAPLIPWLLRRRWLVATGVAALAQFSVSYRGSRLSVEGTPARRGRPRAGDRLPDAAVTCAGRTTRLHELTARPGFSVLLDRDAAPPAPGTGSGLVHVHRLTGGPGRGVVAVRPDGHVGYRSAVLDPAALDGWLRLAGGATSPGGEGCPRP